MARTAVISTLLSVALASSVYAQGTPMPWVVPQFFDASGNPLSSGKLCTFQAGTSTLVNTYTTAALNVTNANPVVMNAGGWPSSSGSIVGIFLRPGDSYKFVLKASNATTCVPDTGTTIWSVDNITAVPVDSGALDIDGTAGENIAAGDVVYLSDGQGGRTVGRWYRTDADQAYASSEAPFIGMAPNSITSGDAGTIRIKGLVTVSGVSSSVVYYVSATTGAVTSTPPTLIRNVGVGYTSTSILLSPQNSGKIPSLTSSYVYNSNAIASTVNGRCTLTSATPITTGDVTAATTLYFTPYQGNQIGLYTGTVWVAQTFAEFSVSVPATTAQMYDVFIDYNDGTPAIAVLAWTNDTTRATALTTQDGRLVKTGDTQQRYVCSFRTTGVSGQTEDSFAKRYVWNYYNRVPRAMRVLEGTNTWASGAGWRYMNNSAANRLECVIGVAEVMVEADVTGFGFVDAGGGYMSVAVGYDTAAGPTTGNVGMTTWTPNNGGGYPMRATLQHYPAVGFHFYGALENAVTGASTWYGDNGTTTMQAGISGWVEG